MKALGGWGGKAKRRGTKQTTAWRETVTPPDVSPEPQLAPPPKCEKRARLERTQKKEGVSRQDGMRQEGDSAGQCEVKQTPKSDGSSVFFVYVVRMGVSGRASILRAATFLFSYPL